MKRHHISTDEEVNALYDRAIWYEKELQRLRQDMDRAFEEAASPTQMADETRQGLSVMARSGLADG